MIFNKQLKAWFSKFRQYKVGYKDGFFRLANLANSPYTIIETFDNVPFCKHLREKKLITANTLFLNAQLYYAELEDGLWILISDLHYKKNVAMKNIYDESLPINYNFINLHYNRKTFKSKSMLINGMVLADKTWSLFKAGNAMADYHFKDSHENNITIYFTTEWFKKQQGSKKYFKSDNIVHFFESGNKYLFLSDTDLSNDVFYEDFLNLAIHNGDYSKNNEIISLVLKFFKKFIDVYKLEDIQEHHFKIPDKDRKNIQQAEKILLDGLLISFPGIETIAKEIGISPTKLKNDFKIIHNQSLYNYYRFHRMQLAHKLLSEKNNSVKEIANLLGYENASKFAAVFKEQFGCLPSSIIRE